jgi:hypothetical protein
VSDSPLDYLTRYRHLEIDLIDGNKPMVDVHEYRNADDYFAPGRWAEAWNKHPEKHGGRKVTPLDYWKDHKHHPADHDVSDGMRKGWPPLAARLKDMSESSGDRSRVVIVPRPGSTPFTEHVADLTELFYCYEGKGTPEAIAQALRLANLCGLVGGDRAALQRYCDDKIGVDCGGFVGNYLRSQHSTHYGPATHAKDFAPPRKCLKRLADVRAHDVFCWSTSDGLKHTGHVAIIDRIESVSRDDKGEVAEVLAWVCESCGTSTDVSDHSHTLHSDGLNCTRYVIRPANHHHVFPVARGKGWEKADGWNATVGHLGMMHVHIARLL